MYVVGRSDSPFVCNIVKLRAVIRHGHWLTLPLVVRWTSLHLVTEAFIQQVVVLRDRMIWQECLWFEASNSINCSFFAVHGAVYGNEKEDDLIQIYANLCLREYFWCCTQGPLPNFAPSSTYLCVFLVSPRLLSSLSMSLHHPTPILIRLAFFYVSNHCPVPNFCDPSNWYVSRHREA